MRIGSMLYVESTSMDVAPVDTKFNEFFANVIEETVSVAKKTFSDQQSKYYKREYPLQVNVSDNADIELMPQKQQEWVSNVLSLYWTDFFAEEPMFNQKHPVSFANAFGDIFEDRIRIDPNNVSKAEHPVVKNLYAIEFPFGEVVFQVDNTTQFQLDESEYLELIHTQSLRQSDKMGGNTQQVVTANPQYILSNVTETKDYVEESNEPVSTSVKSDFINLEINKSDPEYEIENILSQGYYTRKEKAHIMFGVLGNTTFAESDLQADITQILTEVTGNEYIPIPQISQAIISSKPLPKLNHFSETFPEKEDISIEEYQFILDEMECEVSGVTYWPPYELTNRESHAQWEIYRLYDTNSLSMEKCQFISLSPLHPLPTEEAILAVADHGEHIYDTICDSSHAASNTVQNQLEERLYNNELFF